MTSKSTKTVEGAARMIAGKCLAARIRMLNRTITAIYDEALRPLGLTIGQLNILVVIGEHGTLSPGEIAGRLSMEKSTVSRNVGRMRDNGWLTVEDAGSGRMQVLELTRRGGRLLQESVTVWERAQEEARVALGDRGADSMHEAANVVWSRGTGV